MGKKAIVDLETGEILQEVDFGDRLIKAASEEFLKDKKMQEKWRYDK